MQAMEDKTSSLVWIGNRDSRTSRESQTSETSEVSESSRALNASFTFDAEILSSKIYAVAYRSNLRQALAHNKSERLGPVGDIATGQSAQTETPSYPNGSPELVSDSAAGTPHSESVRNDHVDLHITNSALNDPQTLFEDDTELPMQTVRQNNQGATVETFKSFHVSSNDPCYRILPVALQKYKISADWRLYSLFISYGDQERLVGLDEKPLVLFKDFEGEGKRPVFILRRRDQRGATTGDPHELAHPKLSKVKFLILGTSESGKSTWLQAIKLFERASTARHKRRRYSKTVICTVCRILETIIIKDMGTLELSLKDEHLAIHIQMILEATERPFIDKDIYGSIAALKEYSRFQLALKRQIDQHSNDSTGQ